MEWRKLLEDLAAGRITEEEAAEELWSLVVRKGDTAQVDIDRLRRNKIPEVVYAEHKTPVQVRDAVEQLLEAGQPVLVTRVTAEQAQLLRAEFPGLQYKESARIVSSPVEEKGRGLVCVVSAGGADVPVAEEAALTAEFLGTRVERIYDVGVAGIHRVMRYLPVLRQANALVAVAGMEGALPSVVGGLVDRPVIAVPTSVGYGASLQGLAALLAMLNSCVAGVTVVNIDNGFGAGVAAATINRLVEERGQR